MKVFLSLVFGLLVIVQVVAFTVIMTTFVLSADASIGFAVVESVESTLEALRGEITNRVSFVVPLTRYLAEEMVEHDLLFYDPQVQLSGMQRLFEQWPLLFKQYPVTHIFHNFWDVRYDRWNDIVCGHDPSSGESGHFCGFWINDTLCAIADSKNISVENAMPVHVNPTFGHEPWFLSMVRHQKVGDGIFIPPYFLKNEAFDDLQLSVVFQVPLSFNNAGQCIGALSGDMSMEWLSDVLKDAKRSENSFIYVVDALTHNVLATTLNIPTWDPNVCFPGIASEAALFKYNETADARITASTAEAIARYGSLSRAHSFETRTMVLGDALVSFMHIRSEEVLGNLHWVVFHHVERSVYFGQADQTRNRLIVLSTVVTLGVVCVCCLTWLFIHSNLQSIAAALISSANLQFQQSAEPQLGELQSLYEAEVKLGSAINSFTRYVPRDVVRSLMESGEISTIAMHPRHCTIMFVDIHGFTPMSERLAIGTLSKLLEGFFQVTTETVMEHGGVVDKFIGDCVMAVWGAPEPVSDAEQLAVLCALRVVHACRVPPLSTLFEAAGQRLRVRVGVHCGDTLAGNMGCESRMNYTVIGDAVNTAARLEPLCKQFGTDLLISDAVFARASSLVRCLPLGSVKVVGKEEALGIYEPFAALPPPDLSSPLHRLQARAAGLACEEEMTLWADMFSSAVQLYTDGAFEEALAAIGALPDMRGHSEKREKLRARVMAAAKHRSGWTGVYVAVDK